MELAEAQGNSGVRWDDPRVPFLRLANLELQLDTGQVLHLFSQMAGGSGQHGSTSKNWISARCQKIGAG